MQEAESQRAEFMRLRRDKLAAKMDRNAALVHPTDADDAKAMEQQMTGLKKRELADKLSDTWPSSTPHAVRAL